MADPSANRDLRSKVLAEAERKLANNYLGATGDNCAHFVRDCFRDAGYVLPETKRPSDLALCIQNGYGLGPLYANSLAGDEIGRKIPLAEAQPGDIVLFTNLGASSSSFAQGTITHVGICIGDNMMIDHGSSGMHKRDFRIWPGPANYAEARRPRLFDIPKTRIELKDRKISQAYRSNRTEQLDIVLDLETSGPIAFVKGQLGRMHVRGMGGLSVTVNNAAVHHYRAIWVYINDNTTHNQYRLSYQHGRTSASANGQSIANLKCEMKTRGGSLHVLIDDREIRSHEAMIEIVHNQ